MFWYFTTVRGILSALCYFTTWCSNVSFSLSTTASAHVCLEAWLLKFSHRKLLKHHWEHSYRNSLQLRVIAVLSSSTFQLQWLLYSVALVTRLYFLFLVCVIFSRYLIRYLVDEPSTCNMQCILWRRSSTNAQDYSLGNSLTTQQYQLAATNCSLTAMVNASYYRRSFCRFHVKLALSTVNR